MKTLKNILEVTAPKSKDEKRFKDKHVTVKHADRNGNKDDVFQATNVKTFDREAHNYGHSPAEDEKVYESKVEGIQEMARPTDVQRAQKILNDIHGTIAKSGYHKYLTDYGYTPEDTNIVSSNRAKAILKTQSTGYNHHVRYHHPEGHTVHIFYKNEHGAGFSHGMIYKKTKAGHTEADYNYFRSPEHLEHKLKGLHTFGEEIEITEGRGSDKDYPEDVPSKNKNDRFKLKNKKRTEKKDRDDQYESITDENYDDILLETLTKDASAGAWVHDFVHSDDPKFEGKSKKERIKMALGAYYSKH
jgi:hypothetical protein